MENARRIFMIGLASLAAVMLLDAVFDLQGIVLNALGRDPSLTGRTKIWAAISARQVSTLLGSGYRTFFDSEAAVSIWEGTGLNRLLAAHNGYLETYLNGGIIAVVLLVIWLLKAGIHTMTNLVNGDPLGRIALAYWAIALIANNSESSFFMQSPLWFTLLVATIDYRGHFATAPDFVEATDTSNRFSNRKATALRV
jgi:O-antigen ligase